MTHPTPALRSGARVKFAEDYLSFDPAEADLEVSSALPPLETPENGVFGTDLYRYEIYVDGRCVDISYGNEQLAWDLYAEWRETLANDPTVEAHLRIPINKLPNRYWKNGHIEPLRLDPRLPESPDDSPRRLDLAGQKSDLRQWVEVLMATFKLSEYEALLLLAECYPPTNDPPLETIEFPPSDSLTIARLAGARWQDGNEPALFYRPARPGEAHGVYAARFDGDCLSEWKYFSYHEPMSAVVI